MLIDLAIQTVWQWFISEPCQKSHPIVQIESLLLVAQILVERRDNFNERAHDVREESNASQHDKDAKDHFVARLGRQITVADS